MDVYITEMNNMMGHHEHILYDNINILYGFIGFFGIIMGLILIGKIFGI